MYCVLVTVKDQDKPDFNLMFTVEQCGNIEALTDYTHRYIVETVEDIKSKSMELVIVRVDRNACALSRYMYKQCVPFYFTSFEVDGYAWFKRTLQDWAASCTVGPLTQYMQHALNLSGAQENLVLPRTNLNITLIPRRESILLSFSRAAKFDLASHFARRTLIAYEFEREGKHYRTWLRVVRNNRPALNTDSKVRFLVEQCFTPQRQNTSPIKGPALLQQQYFDERNAVFKTANTGEVKLGQYMELVSASEFSTHPLLVRELGAPLLGVYK